ncbi:AAA family ATPase [Sciscionella sediminilitoris]|uniref:AAA family ATPase n=1 Tax=Sciscionella sediminilitoris TaxID=1445613 RepID=UPI000B1F9042|nr:LuxR family transcriptional regulator [Sciscionella sp. SE31]
MDAEQDGTVLTVFAGEPGSGRSTALERHIGETAGSATVLVLRLTEADRELAFGAVFRLLNRLVESDPWRVRPVRAMLARESAVAGQRPEALAAVASAVLPLLRDGGPLVLAVDDAQWLDEKSARLLDPLLRDPVVGSRISVVATVSLTGGREPDPGVGAAFTRLRAEGLARLRLLRPLSRSRARSLIAALIYAQPSGDLVDELHTAARGNPAALTALVNGYRAAGALQVVDRTAYRSHCADSPVGTEEHSLLRAVTGAGTELRELAEASAVLAPLGGQLVPVAAVALGRAATAVAEAVDLLLARRVLVRHRDGGYRFRVPAVRDALFVRLGPYAARNLAACAVRAVREQDLRVPEEVLLDWIAQAGAFVDARHAAPSLLEQGGRVLLTDGPKAERWLSAAAARARTPDQRAGALLLLSAARAVHHRHSAAGDCAFRALSEHGADLEPVQLQELSIVYLTGLSEQQKSQELAEIAEEGSAVLPQDPAPSAVTKAYALIMCGRWKDARELLARLREVWSRSNPVTTDFGTMFLASCEVVAGNTAPLYALLEDPRLWRAGQFPSYWLEERRFELDMLLQLGERGHTEQRMADVGLDTEHLSGMDRFHLSHLAGDWREALELAHRAMLQGVSSAPTAYSTMVQGTIGILTAQGWLVRARALFDYGRTLPLEHVIQQAGSTVLRESGDTEGAEQLLFAAARSAEQGDYLLGTEQLWTDLARSALRRGEHGEAEQWVQRSAHAAKRMGTARARLYHLLAVAAVRGDQHAAHEAVEIAEERRDVPHEAAIAFAYAGLAGYRTERMLRASYELCGVVGAWFWRARLRTLLRERGFAGPGRAEATAENERLLAILVAEGLTNQQLAVVLGTSEKSVEGRLTRLFSRTGFRSRVELAAAILTGEYTF